MREMLLYGLRWPIRRARRPIADSFFVTLANLITDSLDHETPLHLPTTTDPLIAAVLDYIHKSLSVATPAEVAGSIGVSEPKNPSA